MTLFICVDNQNGVAFNRRRQSRDSVLTADILSSKSGIIRMTEYSIKLFGNAEGASVSGDLFSDADGDVFCECMDASEHFALFDRIVIYKWNRDYPHDTVLSKMPQECGFTLVSTSEFAGSSHDNITKEVWCR